MAAEQRLLGVWGWALPGSRPDLPAWSVISCMIGWPLAWLLPAWAVGVYGHGGTERQIALPGAPPDLPCLIGWRVAGLIAWPVMPA